MPLIVDCLKDVQSPLDSTATRETAVIEEMMVDGRTVAWKGTAVSGRMVPADGKPAATRGRTTAEYLTGHGR